MRALGVWILSGAVVMFTGVPQGYAFTSKAKTAALSTSGSITESFSVTVSVVSQGSNDDVGVADTLSFNDDGQALAQNFRDSNEALKVTYTANIAAPRIIISTDNLSATASPKFCDDTAKGNDGGGLVNSSACEFTAPLLWAIADTNVNHSFTTTAIGDDEIFVTDRAHVRTFLASAEKNGTLDNVATKFCDPAATHAVAPTNTVNDGLYPQYFGQAGPRLDICSNAAGAVVIRGKTINSGDEIPDAQELSKNIAVTLFSISGTAALAPNLTTADPADTISVTSPIFLPLAADFCGKDPVTGTCGISAGTYSTNTLTVDLVQQ